MFTLWCAVIPTFHRDAIESLPQVHLSFVLAFLIMLSFTIGKTLFSARNYEGGSLGPQLRHVPCPSAGDPWLLIQVPNYLHCCFITSEQPCWLIKSLSPAQIAIGSGISFPASHPPHWSTWSPLSGKLLNDQPPVFKKKYLHQGGSSWHASD